MRLDLVGGAYQSRSIISSAQKCINYYPEPNPHGAIIPFTYYQRPGLVYALRFGNGGPVRGLYRASTGTYMFAVSGSNVYRVDQSLNVTSIGTMTAGLTTPVSMIDNGTNMVYADGSPTVWQSDMDGSNYQVLSDPTGTQVGADKVDYIDGFIVSNQPNTVFWVSTVYNSLSYNTGTPSAPTGGSASGKVSYPDLLRTLYVNRREVILFGDLKSEVWYNVGAFPFPFQQLPGIYIEHGIIAKYSPANHDINVYWLGQDLQGSGIVFQFRGYMVQRVSNHALEFAIKEMEKTVGISDAIGMTFQEDGHWFYMLTFPAGNQTWVYDAMVQDPNLAWHQEAWTDPTSLALNRHRAMSHAFFNGSNYFGDYGSDAVYKADIDTYTDDIVLNAGASGPTICPITCIRTFPHIARARAQGTQQATEIDGKRLEFSAFRADFESGMATQDFAGNNPPMVTLRWSDDRGRTFGTDVLQTNGVDGEYLTQPQWLGLGIARDRIFEVEHMIMGPAAMNGAWIDAEVLGT